MAYKCMFFSLTPPPSLRSMLARELLQLLLTDLGNLLGKRVDAVGGTLGGSVGDLHSLVRHTMRRTVATPPPQKTQSLRCPWMSHRDSD